MANNPCLSATYPFEFSGMSMSDLQKWSASMAECSRDTWAQGSSYTVSGAWGALVSFGARCSSSMDSPLGFFSR